MQIKLKKISLIIPVHDEEKTIVGTLAELSGVDRPEYMQIIIAENGSTDNTAGICRKLKEKYPEFIFLNLKKKGRGNALRYCFNKFRSDIYCYMDCDLSTDPTYLSDLVKESYNNDIVIGSRYLKGSKAKRTPFRLIISKIYNMLVKMLFSTSISDHLCGFKAFSSKSVKLILHDVKDDGWFFDTEFLILAKKSKLKIKEIPVAWEESSRTTIIFFKDIPSLLVKMIGLKIRLIANKV